MVSPWVVALLLPLFVSGKKPLFFFAGQSNMEGMVDEERFGSTFQILQSDRDDGVVFTVLVDYMQSFESHPATSRSTYELEARELIRLKNDGLLGNDFVDPLSTVRCSFYQLDGEINYRIESNKPLEMAADDALSPYARCGMPFGPELMFGHAMDGCFENQDISIVKFAAGGTEIDQHWSKENGWFWEELVEQVKDIDPAQEEWKGIVWYQGENDSYEEANVDSYLENLTSFIANLREEIHKVDTNIFARPEDIPVVIVGMGCWVTKSGDIYNGPRLAEAQAEFVAGDENAVLVETDDLSCHYHLDDASQIIIGYRVAQAMKEFATVTCGSDAPLITDAPTPGPSLAPTPAPSRAPTPAPTRAPTGAPTDPEPKTCFSPADNLICHSRTNCCSGVGNCEGGRLIRRRCKPVGDHGESTSRCFSAADCSDADICTMDACVSGECRNTQLFGCGDCKRHTEQCSDDEECCSGSCRRGFCKWRRPRHD